MSEAVDLQAVVAFIAAREPLHATLDAFPLVGEDDLRAALQRLAQALAPVAKRAAAPAASARQAAEPSAARAPAASARKAAEPARAPAALGHAKAAGGLKLVVNTDGACRGNPGPSGAGWVISEPSGRQLATGGIFLGRRTNNEAEYLAAAMGLKAAAEMGASSVTLRADSELMVRQLQGRYQVKNAKLLPLFRQVKELCAGFADFTAQHVYREQNAEADHQANLAIDERK